MRALIAAALLLLSSSAQAFITVNEGLPTTRDAVYVGTTTPQLLLNGGTYYAGLVPSVSLYVASNTVLGNCVAYSTGSIMCLGVKLSTGDPVGAYVPYTGATSNVNLGAKTLTTTGNIQVGQVGAGTSAATNFYFDGLSAAGGGYVRIGAGTNQATGYYWGGTRGYSLQERYDLTGTPFTLHDELNNVDRFYLDTSGEWYFPIGVTVDSFTSLGSIKGAGTGLTGTGASFTAGKATALAAAGTSAPSGQLSRGVDASGNNLNASVDATETSGSTNPYQSGGAFTALALKAPIASPTFTGTVSGAAGVFTGTFTAGGFATNGSINASSGTFTATGNGQYSVATSSGIKAAAGDICTATVCLNSVSAGGGSWTGGSVSNPSTFTATLGVGYISSTLTSTASYASVLIGGQSEVAFTTITANSRLWFYNLVATMSYHVEYSFKNNSGSASNFGVQFNADTGNNYDAYGYCTNGIAANALAVNSAAQIYLADISNGVGGGITVTGGFDFKTPWGAPTKVGVTLSSSICPNANPEGCNSTGYYNGSSVITSMALFMVTQNMTGSATLYARPIAQSPN